MPRRVEYAPRKESRVSDVLVLNFTYEAMNVTNLARAVRLVYAGKAEIVADRGAMRSISFEMRLPSIIRMLYFIRRAKRTVALTKKNILLRDNFTCQYCGVKGDKTLTVDHVLPRRAGGRSTWENLVAACYACNQRKGSRTIQACRMPLRRQPRQPSYIPWIVIKSNTNTPEDWAAFLWHEISIEERVE